IDPAVRPRHVEGTRSVRILAIHYESWSPRAYAHVPDRGRRLAGAGHSHSVFHRHAARGYAQTFQVATVNVISPTLTALFGRGDTVRQHALIFHAGRVCAAYALYVVSVLVFIGHSFMSL